MPHFHIMSYSEQHLQETAQIVSKLDPALCEKAVELLATVRARGGRLFILGVGGSAANASHAVNDFRKIAGMECYAPTDNVSELTARTNDEGWSFRFRRMAQRKPTQRKGRAADSLRRRRQSGKKRQSRISWRRCNWRKNAAARFSGLLVEMAATPRKSQMWRL